MRSTTIVTLFKLDGMRVLSEKTVRVPRTWTATRIAREFNTATVTAVAHTNGAPARVLRNQMVSHLDELVY